MNNILIEDSARHPQLFVWNGAIPHNRLQAWLLERNLKLSKDLIELWEMTGGGDLFASETILSPFGDAKLGDDIDSVNQFYCDRGMAQKYLVFHGGTGLSAIRLVDGRYVTLSEDSDRELSEFLTLEDWYPHSA
ncbi:hypothetical protein [Oscillatoria sp. HE19RPO]|uniref:hypothetical protein n=1 Tax=Oscillatoria sp. HE19RPO TaxID=2954806 RepID=UPI0020C51AE9|nr:hypothetical protein [Oscillatoria sp. HE19RPO]